MKRVPLTRGEFALVDDEDFERVNQFKWRFGMIHGMQYALREDRSGVARKNVYMHRFILNAPKDKDTDHADGNGLNNCRSNLRLCTASENMANRRLSKNNKSGFKGVHFCKRHLKFVARFAHKTIGYFHDPKRAAHAYDEYAVSQFGEFALTNKKLGVL